jgi:hypothetical protein
MIVNVVNSSSFFTPPELSIIIDSMKEYAPYVTDAWQKEPVEITTNPYDPKVCNFHLTDEKINRHAYGFHTYENQVPQAYISPYMNRIQAKFVARRSQNIFGVVKEHPDFIIRGKLIRKGRPTDLTFGFISVVLHELAELLVDPGINLWKPWGDKQVLVENADHVNGFHFFRVIQGVKVVMPDFTLPSFYDPAGKAPYSYCNAPTKPFDFITHKSYAYIKDVTGARMMAFAEIGDNRL